jgi:hypothetical protein
MTKDDQAARDEDQVSTERGKMSPRGGKGPSEAATAQKPSAFGDAQRDPGGESASSDSLSEGPMVFDRTGPMEAILAQRLEKVKARTGSAARRPCRVMLNHAVLQTSEAREGAIDLIQGEGLRIECAAAPLQHGVVLALARLCRLAHIAHTSRDEYVYAGDRAAGIDGSACRAC